MVAVTSNLKEVAKLIVAGFAKQGAEAKIVSNLEKCKKSCDLLVEGIQVNLYIATEEEFGAMILFLTGDWQFNVVLRSHAKKQGLKLNQYGVWQGDERLAGIDEKQVFDCLGLPFVEPTNRQLMGRPQKEWPIRY